jgi:hypothetical protein
MAQPDPINQILAELRHTMGNTLMMAEGNEQDIT